MSVTTATPLPDAPRRAIRRTRRGDEKSGQIRSTATELFLRRGYDGVSVEEIVRSVGDSQDQYLQSLPQQRGAFPRDRERAVRGFHCILLHDRRLRPRRGGRPENARTG